MLIKLKDYIYRAYKNYHQSLYKKINLNIEKIDISEEIFNFIKKYKSLINKNIDIINFSSNINKCKEDLNVLFKLFLETIYDEKDNFIDVLFENNIDNNIDNNKDNEEEEINSIYTTEDLIKKFNGFNLVCESYKNQDLFDNFDEENSKEKKNLKR